MPSYVYSTLTHGLQPIKITVEVDSTSGVPNLIVIGLPGKSVDEARERITAALMNSGVSPKAKRTILNLAPADVKKNGSSLELAMCVGLLKLYGIIRDNTDKTAFFGELSLDGSVKPITGALPLVLAAQQLGFREIVLPEENVAEVSILSDIRIIGLQHLRQLIESYQTHSPLIAIASRSFKPSETTSTVQIADVIGQQVAKRALVIAAAGGHNVLLTGPPGAGKSLLAQSICSILPPLTQEEAIEITTLHSLAGLTQQTGLITARPFRAPHHTTSAVGLLGGGLQLKPGEISLAHRGILFLDEFPEFARSSIEALRQPLESGSVTITRAHGTVQYPAQTTLIAAANPCPCGYYGSTQHICRCSLPNRLAYQQKFSGPILDRIDLQITVASLKTTDLISNQMLSPPSSTAQLLATVITARNKQHRRYTKLLPTQPGLILNAHLTSQHIKKLCQLDAAAQQLLSKAVDKLRLSARTYFTLIKVAQTIADLEPSTLPAAIISETHIREALQFRKTLFASHPPLKR